MWYAIIPFYYFLLAVLMYAKYRLKQAFVLATKTVTSLAFVAVAVLALAENPGASEYALWIFAGLGLSVGGDVLLVYGERPRAFVVGLSFFLMAHIAYGTIFAILSGFSVWDAVFFLLLMGIGIAVRQWGRIDLRDMTVPVTIYLLGISFMVSQALSLCLARGGFLGLMAALGALLFYISDALLAWNKFKKPFRAYGALNLITYYTGQLLLALSILQYS